MKKLSTLLSQRPDLLRQARLANLAFAYETLAACAERIARARLTGRVTLTPADPEAGRYCATLVAHEGSQSVIEEHFTDESLLELADTVALVRDQPAGEISFQIETFAEIFLAPLRTTLEHEGVAIDAAAAPNSAR